MLLVFAVENTLSFSPAKVEAALTFLWRTWANPSTKKNGGSEHGSQYLLLFLVRPALNCEECDPYFSFVQGIFCFSTDNFRPVKSLFLVMSLESDEFFCKCLIFAHTSIHVMRNLLKSCVGLFQWKIVMKFFLFWCFLTANGNVFYSNCKVVEFSNLVNCFFFCVL